MGVALIGLSGCQHGEHFSRAWNNATRSNEVAVVSTQDQNQNVEGAKTETQIPDQDIEFDIASHVSNGNVIVYSLDDDLKNPRQFPEYRGVVDNTTSGGYTAFDPSVMVFALDGMSAQPQYLPNYSVPQYAQQKQLMPMNAMVPVPAEPQAVLAQQYQYDKMPTPMISGSIKEKTQVGQRSGPVLTGY